MKLVWVIIVSSLALVACSSTSVTSSDCQSTNWQEKGLQDGRVGVDILAFKQYEQTCQEEGVEADKGAYYLGFKKGLTSYCTFKNGVELGKKGGHYYMACKDFSEFGKGYAKGVDIHVAERERIEVERLTRHRVSPANDVAGGSGSGPQ